MRRFSWQTVDELCVCLTTLIGRKQELSVLFTLPLLRSRLNFYHSLGGFGRSVIYTLRYSTNFRIYFSVSGRAVTDHPFLCSPGIPQVGTELLPHRPGSCPDPGGLPGRECVNSVFGGGCSEPSLVCFSILITCDHRDAGYYLSLCTVCEIINVFGRSPN